MDRLTELLGKAVNLLHDDSPAKEYLVQALDEIAKKPSIKLITSIDRAPARFIPAGYNDIHFLIKVEDNSSQNSTATWSDKSYSTWVPYDTINLLSKLGVLDDATKSSLAKAVGDNS